MKILNFDKLQSPKFNSFKDMTGFLRLNYENINLQKDIRNSRCLIIDSSLFHSNQMKTQKIDHSDIMRELWSEPPNIGHLSSSR